MRLVTVTRRVGEYLGPVDWSYDFRSHFNNVCSPDPVRDEICKKHVDNLRLLCSGGRWEATTYGGWPRCGWGEVLQVGMYDGWPYWKPTPSALLSTTLGSEWASFCSITDIRKQEVRP